MNCFLAKDNATITIINNSDAFGGEKMELVTVGGFYEKNGARYIMYDEKEEMGMADCSVMIKEADGEVTVSRKGAFMSKMRYCPGKATEFIYHMPYGNIPVILYTKKIKSCFDSNGGRLTLFYTLEMQGEIYEHSLSVKVRL